MNMLTARKIEILAAMQSSGVKHMVRHLAHKLDTDTQKIVCLLYDMKLAGLVERCGYGVYTRTKKGDCLVAQASALRDMAKAAREADDI